MFSILSWSGTNKAAVMVGIKHCALLAPLYTTNKSLAGTIAIHYDTSLYAGPYVYANVLDKKHLHSVVVNYRVDWVVHFSALLSAIGEREPMKALEVSINYVCHMH